MPAQGKRARSRCGEDDGDGSSKRCRNVQVAALSECSLLDRDQRLTECMRKRFRVHVYQPSGEKLGLAGVGQGNDRLTLPANYSVQAALQGFWIREATADEISVPGSAWWRPLESKVRAILHSNSKIASPDDFVGMYGEVITALEQEQVISWNERPNIGLAGVRTPSTPSEGGYVSE